MFPQVLISLAILVPLLNGLSISPLRHKRGAEEESAKLKHLSTYYLRVNTDIRTRFATTLLTSKIVNRHTEALEASFDVILPNSAFISNFSLTVADRIIVAEVKEKEQAKLDYDSARRRGQSAAHIAQKSPRESNTFQVSVNVAAGAKVTFNLTYQEILTRSYGVYRHIVNVNPQQIVDDLSIEVNIVEKGMIRGVKVPQFGPGIGDQNNEKLLSRPSEPDAVVTELLSAENSVVNIQFSPSKEKQLETSAKGLSGQFAVLYDVERRNSGGEIQVVNGYFVHFFAPDNVPEGNKHVVFVLDRSGSMMGTKMQQTKAAMKLILSDLRESDYFNIVTFASDVEVWRPESLRATQSAIIEAKLHVDSILADGGTNIQESMARGLQMLQAGVNPVLSSYLVFLTDGQPTSGETRVDRIVSEIGRLNSDKTVAIHSIGFGNDVDFGLLKKISLQNRGVARKIYEDSDATLQLSGFFGEISSPLLANVTISYLNEAAKAVVGADNYNYYRGGEIMMVGKISDVDNSELTADISAMGKNGPQRFSVIRPLPPGPFPRPEMPQWVTSTPHSPLPAGSVGGMFERMWAYQTIRKLLENAKFGDLSEDARKQLKSKALQLSLKYHFVTELTSMVVVLPEELKPTQKQSSIGLEDVQSSSRSFLPLHGPHAVMSMRAGSFSKYPHNHLLQQPFSVDTAKAMQPPSPGTFDDEFEGLAEAEEVSADFPVIPTTTLPPVCQVNETLNFCGKQCDRKCGERKHKCSKICLQPACACKKHFHRNSNDQCVAKHDCPHKACGLNEVFKTCANACEQKSCDDLNNRRICTRVCEPAKCECKAGFVRDRNRKCIIPADCPTESESLTLFI